MVQLVEPDKETTNIYRIMYCYTGSYSFWKCIPGHVHAKIQTQVWKRTFVQQLCFQNTRRVSVGALIIHVAISKINKCTFLQYRLKQIVVTCMYMIFLEYAQCMDIHVMYILGLLYAINILTFSITTRKTQGYEFHPRIVSSSAPPWIHAV